MTAPKYPLLLNLEGRRCIVIGGGRIAAHKVIGLLECGAQVQVIAPSLHAEMAVLAKDERVEVLSRDYAPGDLASCFLVIAATDDPAVNAKVWEESEERGLLLNAVDDPARCNFYVPAVVRRGPLTIAVSTDGKSCAMAARLRRELESRFGDEYGAMLEILGEQRERMKSEVEDPSVRKKVAFTLAQADLASLVAKEGADAARTRALELVESVTSA